MQDEQSKEPIALDTGVLLGMNQIAKVSTANDAARLGRTLSKVGEGPTVPEGTSLAARLLSKIGEPPPPPPASA